MLNLILLCLCINFHKFILLLYGSETTRKNIKAEWSCVLGKTTAHGFQPK